MQHGQEFDLGCLSSYARHLAWVPRCRNHRSTNLHCHRTPLVEVEMGCSVRPYLDHWYHPRLRQLRQRPNEVEDSSSMRVDLRRTHSVVCDKQRPTCQYDRSVRREESVPEDRFPRKSTASQREQPPSLLSDRWIADANRYSRDHVDPDYPFPRKKPSLTVLVSQRKEFDKPAWQAWELAWLILAVFQWVSSRRAWQWLSTIAIELDCSHLWIHRGNLPVVHRHYRYVQHTRQWSKSSMH